MCQTNSEAAPQFSRTPASDHSEFEQYVPRYTTGGLRLLRIQHLQEHVPAGADSRFLAMPANHFAARLRHHDVDVRSDAATGSGSDVSLCADDLEYFREMVVLELRISGSVESTEVVQAEISHAADARNDHCRRDAVRFGERRQTRNEILAWREPMA